MLNVVKFQLRWAHFSDARLIDDHVIAHAYKTVGDVERKMRFIRIEHFCDGLWYPTDYVDPHQLYYAVFEAPNDIPFVWPLDKEPAYHAEDLVVRYALGLAGYGFLDVEDYFIAPGPGQRSLQFEGYGPYVQPGGTYCLRLI